MTISMNTGRIRRAISKRIIKSLIQDHQMPAQRFLEALFLEWNNQGHYAN